MKKKLQLKTILVLVMSISMVNAWGQVTTLSYTGSVQTYTVPVGVTSIQLETWGAQGGSTTGLDGLPATGGLGGYAIGKLDVTPGQVLNVYVGGAGVPGGTGGYNGGGTGATYGCSGGGASDVRIAPYSLTDRAIVGAGGGGGSYGSYSSVGGHGGGLTGNVGGSAGGFTGAGGGTQVAGGAAGCCYGGSASGTFGVGGGTGAYHNAGGGGGWYGGGSGAAYASGGGGSSYIDGVTDASTTTGVRSGNGQVIITVLCTPLTVTVSSEEVCFGEEVILNATSIGGGSISWDGGITNDEAFTPPVGTTTYSATSDADGDCGYSVEILVNELPTVWASADLTEICLGESIVLAESGADTYTWDPADIEAGIDYTPADAGTFTYTLTGTAETTGCSNEATVEVTINELPTVTASVDDASVCDGDSFIFTGDGAVSYSWDMGVVDGAPFTAGIGTETYTVTGTDGNGCANTANVDATVNELPTVTATASETDVCFGAEVTFNGTGAMTYEWDMGVENDLPALMETSGTVTFTVAGTDDNGCINTASVDVSIANEIIITFAPTDEIMGGDGAIDATVTGGVSPYTFDWDNDATGDFDDTEDLSDIVGGDYVLVVKDADGCTNTITINVNSQLGIEGLTAGEITIYPNPTSDQITISSEGNFVYQLVAINGKMIANGTGFNQTNVSLAELADGIYFITLTANNSTNRVKVIKQ